MDKDRLQTNKSKNIIQIVSEGKNSEYWKILSEFINTQIVQEQVFLDSFKSKGIDEKDVFNYNRSRDRLVFMKNFLSVNEKILNENMTIIEKIKKRVDSFSQSWKTVSAFLRK